LAGTLPLNREFRGKTDFTDGKSRAELGNIYHEIGREIEPSFSGMVFINVDLRDQRYVPAA
jgi:hypothetical protein